jgi:guanidinopropionase
VIQIGLRGSRFSPDDIKWGEDRGFTCVTFDDFEAMGRDKLVKQIDRVTGNGPTYITIDIDGLDPAWAIGTGVPEIGGLTPRDCQVIIRALRGKHLVGGDICEVAPCFDPSGITSVTAANLMWEMLCVIADSKSKHRSARR